MIKLIVQMLELDNHYRVSHEVDVAKGINKLPMTIKEGYEQLKRCKAWQ